MIAPTVDRSSGASSFSWLHILAHSVASRRHGLRCLTPLHRSVGWLTPLARSAALLSWLGPAGSLRFLAPFPHSSDFARPATQRTVSTDTRRSTSLPTHLRVRTPIPDLLPRSPRSRRHRARLLHFESLSLPPQPAWIGSLTLLRCCCARLLSWLEQPGAQARGRGSRVRAAGDAARR